MAGRDRRDRAARADDLEPFARLLGLVGAEVGKLFFEEPAHQGETPRIVLNVVELIAQRRHAKRDRYPVDDPGGGEKRRRIGREARVQAHDRAGPLDLRHAGKIDPDKLSRASADIDDEQLLGLGRHERRTGHDGKPRLLLGLDDVKRQPGLALDCLEESRAVLRPAAGLGRHQTHVFDFVPVELRSADAQGLQRPAHRPARQPTRRFKPQPELHRFREAVHDMELIALGLGNQHSARIRAQIQRSVKLCWIGCLGRDRLDLVREPTNA